MNLPIVSYQVLVRLAGVADWGFLAGRFRSVCRVAVVAGRIGCFQRRDALYDLATNSNSRRTTSDEMPHHEKPRNIITRMACCGRSWQGDMAEAPQWRRAGAIDEFTSSENANNLFNLTPPPSFLGPFLVWGETDAQAGTLNLFLAPSTGDRSVPFATLNGFVAAIDGSGGAASGSGTLSRSNKLPPNINWNLNP